MYDIAYLEGEWKRYKRKKRKPYFILLFLFIFFSVVSWFFIAYKTLFFVEKKSKTIEISKLKDVKSDFIKESNVLLLADFIGILEVNKVIKAKVIKSPTEALSRTSVGNDLTIPIKKHKSVKIRKDIKQDKAKIKKSRKKKKVTQIKRSTLKKKTRKKRTKKHVNILETESISAYAEVSNRFRRLRDPNDSLFLAKNYYKNGNYKKAEHWALLTNRVDSSIEDSWIIFAQSKLKQGKKNEAIQILQSYVKRSNSDAARRILYKIK